MSIENSEYVEKDCSVRVAVRIRPQNPREKIDLCRVCATVTPGEPQIILGIDKAFTFDYVFDVNSEQTEIYSACVERLVAGALRGYNATVLAYGQTGSGKTYTMGTGFEHDSFEQQQGIIPRAVRHIFSGIEEMQTQANEEGPTTSGSVHFSVAVQFLELYNEDIVDLLDPFSSGKVLKIHEDNHGQICVSGLTIKPINDPQEAIRLLQQGALARTTASTQMNDQSSRSHALFTILIRRQRIIASAEGDLMPDADLETLTSKFHFVDLAGSERLKRTGATGERAREGISINSGLLCLGNCISALGDKSKKATHVPYRDSKLTRLLQDSLGGNSQTIMIACVSPSDRDFMETLNTLKYANRARNIKNKVQINQDQSSRTISQLRREIAALQLELLEYKQGKRIVDSEGNCSISDTFHENVMLQSDQKRQQQRIKAMQETISALTHQNAQYKLLIDSNGWTEGDSDSFVSGLVEGYIREIEELKGKLIESEGMYHQLKKEARNMQSPRSILNIKVDVDDPENLITRAKKELEREREQLMSKSLPGYADEDNVSEEKNGFSENDDSDSDCDEKANEMENDLNDINADIEIKTRLIEELERSQHRMQIMKSHYEEKLKILTCKITNTQKERDDVLANLGNSQSGQSSSQVKHIRDDYEKKINSMQKEMKKLQQAQKEHTKQRREIQTQEAKLINLRKEVADLKSVKVQLMRKINEQTNRYKEDEKRKAREIAKLRKEQRKQLNTVKSLQTQMQVKEQILRRKTEEVTALRRNQRGPLSEKAAGRVRKRAETNLFDARQARQRWTSFSRTISHLARNKQILMQLEKEMERLVNERESLSKNLTGIQKSQNDDGISDLLSEEDTIKSNLNYVQENITEVQQAIMELEEGKHSNSKMIQEMQNIIGEVRSVDEAKFLLERLSDSAITFSCSSHSNKNRLFELEALLSEAQQENSVQQQLLQHFLAQNDTVQMSDLFDSLNLTLKKPERNDLSGSQNSLHSNGTYDIPVPETQAYKQLSTSRSPSPSPTIDICYDKNDKIRKRTAQPQDLLFGDMEKNQNKEDIMTRSFNQRPDAIVRSANALMRVPSAPGSLKQTAISPSVAKASEITQIPPTTQSPRLSRRQIQTKGSALDDENFNSSNSPPVYRKMMSREDTFGNDVFSRLGAGQQDPTPGGSIQKLTGKVRVGAPLYCTHTVSGHSNAVLSIKVYEHVLYTAAADRTVKVWDLNQETAQHCLSLHPGPVVALENDNNTQLLFSASGSYVRVWDLRTSNCKPIKTLTSSGLILAGNTSVGGTAPGESAVTALSLGSSGNLYVAASDKVRIWELRSLSCIGKLSGGHQAAVMCVSAWNGGGEGGTDFVATGSKDHYVKVFEVTKAGGLVYPLLHLEPPHYDGVQALAVAPNPVGAEAELFSGSRDSGIKRWDLKSGELKQSLNNAHKGWISGMAVSGDVLLSSCRAGIIRLWNVKTCESLSEMKTNSAINDIVTSGQRIFTASSDGGVRIWRFTNALRRNYSVEAS